MVSLIRPRDPPDVLQDWTASLRAVLNADIVPLETFDERDPLGFAFYTLVLLRTRLVIRATEKLPAAARQWAETKLVSAKLSPYRDHELGAVGLLVYAFSEYDIPLTDGGRLGELVQQESSGHGLLFDSFFLTSLIALGLAKTAEGCPPEFVTAVEEAIASETARVANDPKALLAGFWFTRAIGRKDLSERLFRVADGILSAGDTHLDNRVCSAAILLEELEQMTMQQRLKVVTFAQDCIRSLGVEAAGGIEMLVIEEGHFAPAPMRVSRILVSLGLLCRDLLERKSTLLLTKTERTWQIVRALVYAPISALLAVAIVWGLMRIRPAHSITSEMLVAPSFSTAALSLVLLVAYTAVVGVLIFALVAIYELIVGLAVLGKRRDEIAAFHEAWRFVVAHYKVEFGLGLIAGVLFDTLILRG